MRPNRFRKTTCGQLHRWKSTWTLWISGKSKAVPRWQLHALANEYAAPNTAHLAERFVVIDHHQPEHTLRALDLVGATEARAWCELLPETSDRNETPPTRAGGTTYDTRDERPRRS